MIRLTVPGRANLIGEHTDYNDGLALAFAVEQAVVAEVTVGGPKTVIASDRAGAWSEGSPPTERWQELAAAVIAELRPTPRQIAITSSIPLGAGLSSSTAFVGAVALSCGASANLDDLVELILRCERASGSDVGPLDPMAVLAARREHGCLLDFARLTVEQIEWPGGLCCTAVHTGVTRDLATTAYRDRRTECAAVAERLGPWGTLKWSDLTGLTDETLARRARHVLSEIQRVREAAVALADGDLEGIGRLVSASHASLRDDFEVSIEAIDALVSALVADPLVLGARLMGGGFGGCVLVVHRDTWHPPVGRPAWPLAPSDGALARLG